MPEKFNAARRVRNILGAARQYHSNVGTLNVWAGVFGTTELEAPQFETFRLLGVLREQVEKIRSEIEPFDLDPSDVSQTFSNIMTVLGVTNLDSPWQQHQGYITDATLSQLGIFSRLSPVNEQEVPPEDITQLKQDLLNFHYEVSENVSDDRLKAFVLKQIAIILQAIREYPIRGEEAIRDGNSTLLATSLSEHEIIREHKGEEVVEKTMTFWERMSNLLPWGNFGINLARMLMDIDVDPQKAIEAGSKAIEAGGDVVDKF